MLPASAALFNLHVMSTQAIILFDGVCNFCNRSVQYVARHDPDSYFKFAWLQSETGKQLLNQYGLTENDLDTFVLIENSKAFTRSTAALKVAKKLKGAIRLLYGFIIVPLFIRDMIYRIIAKKRYKWFGKNEACVVPTALLKDRFIN